jgi:hypothetical protein
MFGYDAFGTSIFHGEGTIDEYFSPDQPATTSSGDKNVVTLYEHCMRDSVFDDGWVTKLDVGEYDASGTLGVDGLKNDAASSMWVPEGMTVTVKQHSNTDDDFPGMTKSFVGPLAVTCFADITGGPADDGSWNDSISNIMVQPTVGGGGSGDPDAVYGCMATNATNYDETVTEDNGSCLCEEGFELNDDNTECVEEASGMSDIIKYSLYGGIGLAVLLMLSRR